MTWFDLDFPVYGDRIPVDHGAYLYAGLSTLEPALHSNPEVCWSLISGQPQGPSWLLVRRGRLLVRAAPQHVVQVAALGGKVLRLGRWFVELGAPVCQSCKPSRVLASPYVMVSSGKERKAGVRGGLKEPEAFSAEILHQARQLGAEVLSVELGDPVTRYVAWSGAGDRKGRKRAPERGYPVRLLVRDDASSLAILRHGLGGRRSYGAGFFEAQDPEDQEKSHPSAAPGSLGPRGGRGGAPGEDSHGQPCSAPEDAPREADDRRLSGHYSWSVGLDEVSP